MSLLSSVIEKFKLLSSQKNVITDGDLFIVLFDYYTSSDVIDDYEEAVKQLDKKSLNENEQWLLFTGFQVLITSACYTDQFRDKLCLFWLPIYQSLFKQLLSKPQEDDLSLNGIKYLITNLIEIQQTFESTIHFIKTYSQFQNFSHKDEYLSIIKILLPLLINGYIIKYIKNDDYNKRNK